MAKKTKSVFPRLIGVIHLGALPGSPMSPQSEPQETIHQVGYKAIQEAKQLVKAGFQGLIIENYGDAPFYKSNVPPETIAAMTIIAAALRDCVKVPVGINVLRNDVRAALCVASASGCEFIRTNILSGVAATDQGFIEGDAATLIRERDRLGASTQIFADVQVKHSVPISQADLELSISETIERSFAQGVIVTGNATGDPVNMEELQRAHHLTQQYKVPLLVGSGVDGANIKEILEHADGAIIGSAFRKGGVAGQPIDSKRLSALISSLRKKTKTKKKAKLSKKRKR